MLSNDQVVQLYTLLLNTRGNDRWPLARVALHIGASVRTASEKNALRYQIKKLRKRAELEYLANVGTGYFIPEVDVEFEEVHNAFKNRANGMAETANKFKHGAARAKKATREFEQVIMELDDVGEQ